MTSTPRFGVDLITFYNPAFWGLPDDAALQDLSDRDPDAVWKKILDSAYEAGITSLEVTFGPANTDSIRRAFGSAKEFKRELDGRGMELKSAFYLEGSWAPDADRGEIAEQAGAYARFIKEAGGDVLVAAPPMRTTWNAEPPQFNDFDFLKNVADIAHVVGRASLLEGVTTALHTEAHSSFCTARDVDLLMALTDPLFVGLCPDTGHLALSGGDPTRIASRHRERVVISHWKDATGPAPLRVPVDDSIHESHRDYFRRVGAGSIDWFAWGRLMREIGFTDLALLELDAVPDPVAEMTAAREFIERSLSAVYP